MTRAAFLFNAQEKRVLVAVPEQGDEFLSVSAGLALAPEPPPRARPVAGVSAGEGFREGFAVHPREHEDVAVFVILDDGGNESVGVEAHGADAEGRAGRRTGGRAGRRTV